jgi:hypothetical protein
MVVVEESYLVSVNLSFLRLIIRRSDAAGDGTR